MTGYSIPLATGQHTITITADSAVRWTKSVTYVIQTITNWAINEQGESYGVQNANGTPDLVAVIATNGKTGYAHSADLADADGTQAATAFKNPEEALAWQRAHKGMSFSVPVYESDGTTLLGEFIIGG